MHMKSQGVQQVTIVSRTMAHAARTAEAIGGAARRRGTSSTRRSAPSDIVITATGAADADSDKAHIEAVMRPRRNRPLFIIDIAMPRDVEAGGRRNRAGVPLQHRRPAGDGAREPRAARQRSRARGGDRRRGSRRSSARGCARAARFRPSSRCAQRFETIRRAELERLEFKLSALPPEARARVDEITHLIVEKLLLTPTEQLKSLGDAETVGAYAEALTRLFGLADDDGRDGRDRRATRRQGRAVRPRRDRATRR